MLDIVIYSHHVRIVSGIQTWERAFIESLNPYFNIRFVYRTANVYKLKEFQEIVECVEYNGQEIECDVCIYSSTIRKSPKIKAKKYIQVIHADLLKWDSGYNPQGVDIHIAVSEVIKEEVKKDFNIDCLVIPNILPKPQIEKVIRFITCSRIGIGKGFERMVIMAKLMKEKGYRFTWEVYGGGSGQSREYLYDLQEQLKDIPEVMFLGPKDKIESYIVKADYLVQLSDHEGFCYSIHEALNLGIPVIVTDWNGIGEVVQNGKNGYIVDMAMSNLDLDTIYKQEIKGYLLKSEDSIKKWVELIRGGAVDSSILS